MSDLLIYLPGLVLAATVLLIVRGYALVSAESDDELQGEEVAILRDSTKDRAKRRSLIDRLAGALARRLREMLPEGAIRWLQKQVNMAGRPDGMDVDSVLRGIARWLLILSPAIVLFVMQGNLVLVLVSFLAAAVLPLARVAATARKRREQIDRDMPDFIDVLAVTVTAGVGFRAALRTVADRFGGPLGEEVMTVLHQIDNGASLRSAFRGMRERTDSEAVEEFVTAYLQSEELGAPLADTLTHIAADMRRAASQRLRQQAARVEPRVTLVVTTVMVPGTLILLAAGMFLGPGGGDLGGVFGE